MEQAPQPPKLPTYFEMLKQRKPTNEERIQAAKELEESTRHALLKARNESMATLTGLPVQLHTLIMGFLAQPGTYAKIKELAQSIIALAETNKAMHAAINNPQTIITILNAMPYDANKITLAELLQKKPGSLPIMKNKQVQDFLAQISLINGQELWEAVGENQEMVAKLLTEKNIDLNWHKWRPQKPLRRAAYTADIVSVRLLLNAGADPNIIDNSGTILHDIVQGLGDNSALVKLFLDAGADPYITVFGKLASTIGRETGHIAEAKLIEEAMAKQKANQMEKK
jgi:hypothetical protein